MFIPDYMYYEPKSKVKERLTTIYQPLLDVQTALQNNPKCWIESNIATTQQKKIIVINDIFDVKSSHGDIESMTNWLIKKGFRVFISLAEGVKELGQGELNLKTTKDEANIISTKSILAQMSNFKVVPESVEIMDRAAILHLRDEVILGEKIEKSTLKDKTFQILTDTDIEKFKSTDEIITDIQFFSPSIPDFSSLGNRLRYIKKLNGSLDFIDFIKQVKALKNDYFKELEEIDLSSFKNVEPLDESIAALLDTFPKLYKIRIQMNTERKMIRFIAGTSFSLPSHPNRKVLVQEGGAATNNIIYDEIQTVLDSSIVHKPNSDNPEIFTLSAYSGILSIKEIGNLLKKVNINDLYLNSLSDADYDIPFDGSNILKIDLGRTPDKATAALLSSCPNVEALSLNSNLPMLQRPLSKLYSLTISQPCISIETTAEEIKKFSPNINNLSLCFSHAYENEIISDAIKPIFSLKSLWLNFPDVHSKNYDVFQHLKKLAPNVEKIFLQLGKVSVDFNPSDFPKLKNIEMAWGNFPYKVTLSDLLKVPSMESIELSNAICSKEFFCADEIPAKLHLKKLDFMIPTYEKIDFHYLAKIISRSLNLENLQIKGIKNWNELIKILFEMKVKLPKLHSIYLAESNLNYDVFQMLETIAPNLKEINISNTPLGKEEEKLNKLKYNIQNFSFPSSGSYSSEVGDNLLEMDELDGVESFENDQQPSNNRKKDTQTVKSDTRNKECKFNLTQVFYSTNLTVKDPDISSYRNSIFHSTADGNPLQLTNIEPDSLISYENFKYGNDAVEDFKREGRSDIFAGEKSLEISNNFTALPSLFAHEHLKAINVLGIEQSDIEIKYSTRDQLYYIRKKSLGTKQVFLDFIIEEPKLAKVDNIPPLNDLLSYVRSFGEGELKYIDRYSGGREIVEEMYSQKKGKCDQRSAVFKYKARSALPEIPIRVVTNDCHAFVEILQDNQWRSYDLGGYPAKQKINKALRPSNEPAKDQSLPSIGYESDSFLSKPINPRYITWDTATEFKSTADHLAIQALNQIQVDSKTGEHLGSNVLLQCESDTDVNVMNIHLQKVAKSNHKAVYVINSPDDIVCQGKWLKRQADNSGKSMDGPGGPLYDFLTKTYEAGEQPIIIVNWNNFSADELVRFNSLIDAQRVADGVPIPKNMVVVGLYNTTKPDAYTGSDFHSRSPVKIKVSSASQVGKEEVKIDFQVSDELKKDKEEVKIELYQSKQWKELLLGQWTIEGGTIQFKEGELVLAIKEGKSVQLNNAPWHLPEFVNFWQTAKVRGTINTVGEVLNLPENFWDKTTQSTGYDWQLLTNKVTFVDNPELLRGSLVVNLHNISHFMPHYDIKNRLPERVNGLFEKYQGKTLPILVTQTLSIANWHQLLKEAAKCNVQLQISCPESVSVPNELQELLTVKYLKNRVSSGALQLIETDDVGMSLENLRVQYPNAKPIDVSECDQTDIIYNVTPDFKNGLAFNEQFGDVWQKLRNNETVILKGHFKNELINTLLPLCTQEGIFINGKMEKISGKLILLSDAPLTDVFEVQVVNTSLNEKLNTIWNKYPTISESQKKAIIQYPWPATISLVNIQAAVNHFLRFSPASFDFSEGITKITLPSVIDSSINLTDDHVKKVCDEFVASRLSSLRSIFNLAPFAFVGGKTGVGKSTFMKRYLVKENGFKLYNEMTDIQRWMNDRTPGLKKVLFFDEANISDVDYSMFEGLYEVPPFILYKGKIVELTPDHTVILAGNPMSYGGERHLPKLLADHGNACTFDIIPKEYIYEKILKPVFNAVDLPVDKTQQYSHCILSVYQKICEMAEEEVLISPRELKMMAMIITSSKNAAVEYTNIVYDVAKQCIPSELKNVFSKWFNEQFVLPVVKPFVQEELNSSESHAKPFVLTHSREPIYQSMQRLLAVRQNAITSPHKALQEPGLGGILLEGEPGTGKSHFLVDTLMKQGYKSRSIALAGNENEIDPNSFYVLPASLSFTEKKRVLLAAFDEGIPVVIDEINSGPMMEQMLNALLMGEHPITKEPPRNPGFLLMATQNPISMSGRQATSLAIARRTLFHDFPAYDKAEMLQILKVNFKQLSDEVINQEIDSFMQAVQFAKRNEKEPAPVFRDLLNAVKKIADNHLVKMELSDKKNQSPKIENRVRAHSIYFDTKKSSFDLPSVGVSALKTTKKPDEIPTLKRQKSLGFIEKENQKLNKNDNLDVVFTKLAFNQKPDDLIQKVAENDPSIQHLQLKACGIAAAHMTDLAKALLNNDHLLSLDISDNGLVAVPEFIESLKMNKSLKYLNIQSGSLEPDYIKQIAEVCEKKGIRLEAGAMPLLRRPLS